MSLSFRSKSLTVSGFIVLAASMFIFSENIFAQGATFYVAKSGDDSNGCYNAQYGGGAMGTIAGGISCMSGGDTLIIGDGVYAEQINNTIPSGSPDAPTVIRAANRNGVVVRPDGTQSWFIGVVTIYARSYITVDGVDADASNVEEAYYVIDGSTGIVLQNGTARNGQGIYGSGIELKAASGNQVLNMDIASNGTGTAAHGIYVSGSNNLIEGNRIYRNSGYGVHIYGYGNTYPSYNTIRYNEVFANVWGSAYVIPGLDNAFYDNLLYDNGEKEVIGQ
jgi:hypothetical protein